MSDEVTEAETGLYTLEEVAQVISYLQSKHAGHDRTQALVDWHFTKSDPTFFAMTLEISEKIIDAVRADNVTLAETLAKIPDLFQAGAE